MVDLIVDALEGLKDDPVILLLLICLIILSYTCKQLYYNYRESVEKRLEEKDERINEKREMLNDYNDKLREYSRQLELLIELMNHGEDEE